MNIIDSFRLDGRVALVTGAGRGIGEGIALGLAEAGADLALVSRTESELERVAEAVRALGRRAVVVPCDVGDVAAIPPAVQLARIFHEGFVNNPGLPDVQPFPPAAGGYLVARGSGTHPPGWVRCHRVPATPDPFRTAAPKGSY